MPNTAEAAAFLPAIEALRLELFRIEQEASDVRALLEGLRAYADIAEPIERAEAKKRLAAAGPASGKGKKKTGSGKFPEAVKGRALDKALQPKASNRAIAKTLGVSDQTVGRDTATNVAEGKKNANKNNGKKGGDATNVAPALTGAAAAKRSKADDQAAAAELEKIVATIAEATAEVQSAMLAKDADKLSAAISARAKTERVAGKLLVALSGRLRPLPITKVQSKKYRRDAELTAEQFAIKVRRAQRKAVAAMRDARQDDPRENRPENYVPGRDTIPRRPPEPAPAKPERAKDRPSHAAPPRPKMKLTPWTTDATGALSRTLTAEVDGSGAEAP